MPAASTALPLNVTPGTTPSRPSASPISSNTTTQAKVNGTKPLASSSDISSPHELTAFVETLLEQLDSKFDDMSNQMLDRMMQMSTRVDALEASIQDIINSDGTSIVPSLPQSPLVAPKKPGVS